MTHEPLTVDFYVREVLAARERLHDAKRTLHAARLKKRQAETDLGLALVGLKQAQEAEEA